MYDKMARLGLVTLELLLADLREPVLAGDLPVRMDLEKASYEKVGDGSDYDSDAPAGGDPEDGGCGCGGDGCGDGSCGGGCGGGCGAEMMPSMEGGPQEGPARDLSPHPRRIPPSPPGLTPSGMGTGRGTGHPGRRGRGSPGPSPDRRCGPWAEALHWRASLRSALLSVILFLSLLLRSALRLLDAVFGRGPEVLFS